MATALSLLRSFTTLPETSQTGTREGARPTILGMVAVRFQGFHEASRGTSWLTLCEGRASAENLVKVASLWLNSDGTRHEAELVITRLYGGRLPNIGLEDLTAPEISEIYGGRKGRPSGPQEGPPVSSLLEDVEVRCILEPVCLDAFIFAECLHPEVECTRHRYEMLADREGERTYSPAEWRHIKAINPDALVQMVEEVRNKVRFSTR